MLDVQTIELAYNRVYVVDGAGWRVLVDTGPDYAGAWEVVQAALGGRQPDLVVATHGHMDHAGMGGRWARAGVPVALGAEDRRFGHGPEHAAEDYERLEAYARTSGAEPDVLKEAIAAIRLRRQWARLAGGEGYPDGGKDGRWPTGLRYEAFEPSLMLSDGRLPIGELEVVMSPGHTPGNLVLFGRESGALFSGDQLLRDITPTPALQFTADGSRFASLPRFLDSMRRLEAYDPVRCYPGHGESFGSVANVIAANLDQVEQRADRVWDTLKAQGPAPVYPLAERIYPRAARRRFWQIVSTVQGCVDLLVEEGLAEELDGVVAAL